MSGQSSIVPPPLSGPGNGPSRDPGQVGSGIFLALIISAGSGLFGALLGGCFGVLLLPLVALLVAIIIANASGKPQTAKGLWIGMALSFGILLIWAASLCGGMFRP